MRTPLGASAMRARSRACICVDVVEERQLSGTMTEVSGSAVKRFMYFSVHYMYMYLLREGRRRRPFIPVTYWTSSVIDVVATIGDVTIRETVQRTALTVADLHALVVANLAQRAPHLSTHTVQLTVGGSIILPVDGTPLTAIQSDVVQCTVRCAPQLLRCAPLWGAGGCTVVTVHGVGLEAVGGSPRLRFGRVDVPCQRTSSTTMRCIAPDHPPGIVNVRLVRCEEDDSDEDEASFEFVRLETAYEVLFATTNSHCPVRGAARGDEERVRGWTPND